MNELNLTLKNSQIITLIKNDDNSVYRFQVTTSHNGSDTSTITSYPTSEGTPRTDNIYNNPDTLNFAAQISGNSNISDEWGYGVDRPKNALSMLTNWKNTATSFTIQTPQKDYFNMFITSLAPAATTTNAYDLNISLTFTELIIPNFSFSVVGPFEDAIIEVEDSVQENNGANDGQELSEFDEAVEDASNVATSVAGGALAAGAVSIILTGGVSLAPIIIGGIIGAMKWLFDW